MSAIHTAGFDLLVAYDTGLGAGEDADAKRATHVHRRTERLVCLWWWWWWCVASTWHGSSRHMCLQEACADALDYCYDGAARYSKGATTLHGEPALEALMAAAPQPMLAHKQVRATLERLGAQTVDVLGEADAWLAAACAGKLPLPAASSAAGTSARVPFAVLSQDSDFFVFPGTRYIPLSEVTVERSAGTAAAPGGDPDDGTRAGTATISCGMYDAGAVAASLGVSVAQLPDVAAFCGNDYTKGGRTAGCVFPAVLSCRPPHLPYRGLPLLSRLLVVVQRCWTLPMVRPLLSACTATKVLWRWRRGCVKWCTLPWMPLMSPATWAPMWHSFWRCPC